MENYHYSRKHPYMLTGVPLSLIGLYIFGGIHPRRLTYNLKMMVSMMIFLFQGYNPYLYLEYIPGPSSLSQCRKEDIAALRLELNELRAAKGLPALGSKEKLFCRWKRSRFLSKLLELLDTQV